MPPGVSKLINVAKYRHFDLIEKNNRLVSIFVFVVFGGLLLVKGIAGFWG